MKSKLLVIGGSGLVGSTLIPYASPTYDIHYTYNTNKVLHEGITSTRMNLLTDKNKITALIKEFNPDVVINTAAQSSVDLCEINHKIADELHIDTTQNISNICKENNSKLIYLSTDAVFPGKLNKKYTESDKTNPENYYGKTKLRAEQIILNSSQKNIVLRTAVIYGWHKKSRWTNWILQTLEKNTFVDPYIDQYNTPTLVNDLVKSILKIIEEDISGLFHATGKSCISRYDFALELANKFGFDKKLVQPVTSQEKKQDAPRPTSTCLDSGKLEKLINFNFCDIHSGVSFIFHKSKS